MISHELTINNKTGLHARPAALWVKTAASFQSAVRIRKADREVDGKSLLGILSLGLSAGSTFRLTVDGPDAAEAADALIKLVADLAAEETQQG